MNKLRTRKPSAIIEVPADLLHFENQMWLDCAFVYALDSATIGIAGHEMPEWNEIFCFIEKIPITKDKEKIILQIPEKFSRFYNIDRKQSCFFKRKHYSDNNSRKHC
jgi:hypothetical protein